MSEPENVQLIQSLYAAFGRGDIPALLEGLSDSVEWTNPLPTKCLKGSPIIPDRVDGWGIEANNIN